VAATADGKRAVSAVGDALKVWDLETERELFTLEGHTWGISAVALSPDGKRAISASSPDRASPAGSSRQAGGRSPVLALTAAEAT